MQARGFTLLELMIVMAIMAAIAGLSGPRAIQLYDSVQYQSAVRELLTALNTARYRAIRDGQHIDFMVNADTLEYRLGDDPMQRLPEGIHLDMLSAGELSERAEIAVYRFYPDGSSSGGHLHLLRETASSPARAATINIDWLLGRITYQPEHSG